MARVLLEYGFVHPRPLAMPKNRAGFIIATLEGLNVDWSVIVADSLRTAIAAVMDNNESLGRISTMAYGATTTNTRPQTEEIGTVGDHAKQAIETATTPGQTSPKWIVWGSIPTDRISSRAPERSDGGENSGENSETD